MTDSIPSNEQPSEVIQDVPQSSDLLDGKVREFFELMEKRSNAKKEDRKAVEQEAAEFVSTLTDDQKEKIRGIYEGVEELQAIDAQRLVVRSRTGQILSFIPNTIHTVSDPIARTSKETIEFALNLLGHTGAGLWGGLKKFVNAFRQAA
ncbi:hypothetical protein KKF55_06255 [Patescibacteria group bacterium]|nr:hypothetical protein [Patescibacteria group bacterium]